MKRTFLLCILLAPGGRESTTLVNPSQPWVEIAASRGALAVVGAYLVHGIQHISFGVDHLLFVLGLLLIVGTGAMPCARDELS